MATHPHEPPVAAAAPSPEAEDGEERADWQDRYTRLAADLQNLRRRADRKRVELQRFGAEPLTLSLLPVLDNLQLALDAARSGTHSPRGCAR